MQWGWVEPCTVYPIICGLPYYMYTTIVYLNLATALSGHSRFSDEIWVTLCLSCAGYFASPFHSCSFLVIPSFFVPHNDLYIFVIILILSILLCIFPHQTPRWLKFPLFDILFRFVRNHVRKTWETLRRIGSLILTMRRSSPSSSTAAVGRYHISKQKIHLGRCSNGITILTMQGKLIILCFLRDGVNAQYHEG